ncbi:MAG: hypothetical protein AB1568_06985 [Thermodesulfobacteriota bacterium]
MELLQPLRQHEYPAGYLAARLRGRAAAGGISREEQDGGRQPAAILEPFREISRTDGPWLFLRHECRWVYARMNSRLRRGFAPLYLYLELPFLLAAIRTAADRDSRARLAGFTDTSLLHPNLVRPLTGNDTVEEILAGLAEPLASLDQALADLPAIHGRGGPAAVDAAVTNGLFASLARAAMPTEVRDFFRRLIDGHNLILLHKIRRWQPEPAPSFFAGGAIDPDRFRAAIHQDGEDHLFLRRLDLPPSTAVAQGRGLENAVFAGIARHLRRQSLRGAAPAAVILRYLWDLYLFVRRASLLARQRLLPGYAIEEEPA